MPEAEVVNEDRISKKEPSKMLLLEIFFWFLSCFVVWIALHGGQQGSTTSREKWPSFFIKVPDWIYFLCGKPLPNNTLEISRTLGQLASILLLFSWIPLAIWGIPVKMRIELLIFGMLLIIFSTVIIDLFFTYIVGRFRK